MSQKTKNLILFSIMTFIWSTTWAALKLGLEEMPPAVGLALRFGIAAILLLTFAWLRKLPIERSWDHIKLYLIVGLFNMALSYFCTYWGTQFIPSSLSSILWSTMPIMLGLMAHFFIKEDRMTILKGFAIIVSTIGVVMILSDQKLILNKETLTGSLIVLLAVFTGSFPNIYTKKFTKDYNSLVLTGIAMAIASLFHSIIASVTGQWARTTWDITGIASVIYLGVFGSAITFSIYYYLIKHISVVKVSFLTFITPIGATLIGWLFLNETITLKEMIGCLIIFSGIFLYDSRKYLKYFKNKKI
ncbi:MAG: DMT family transporter [Candidatus Marinimicrobia bacterium]|nr:DMT family transporter [Candidatus Neomarinimicrobiota bacterium]